LCAAAHEPLLHTPVHPSLAPQALPVQLGTHMQTPARQVWFEAAQVPVRQGAPQPLSAPQALPPQLGVQPQTPGIPPPPHVWPAVEQEPVLHGALQPSSAPQAFPPQLETQEQMPSPPHTSPVGHGVAAHAPLVHVSRFPLLHRCAFSVQTGVTQALLTQSCVPPQQAVPQLIWPGQHWLLRMHTPLPQDFGCVAGHEHVRLLHTSTPAHAWPQEPQLLRSVVTF